MSFDPLLASAERLGKKGSLAAKNEVGCGDEASPSFSSAEL